MCSAIIPFLGYCQGSGCSHCAYVARLQRTGSYNLRKSILGRTPQSSEEALTTCPNHSWNLHRIVIRNTLKEASDMPRKLRIETEANLKKAREAALLAVETYNTPGTAFRSAGCGA